MDSRSIGADLSFAWPTNEIAVMGAEGAANVIFRREIAAADDPEAVRALRIAEYQAELMHPYYAAERGLVDDVIDPAETRSSADPVAGHAARQAPATAVTQARESASVTGLIRIVRGNPDDTELAALIAVLLAARSPGRSRAPGDALPADRPARAGWCHSEAGYRSPRSWSSR